MEAGLFEELVKCLRADCLVLFSSFENKILQRYNFSQSDENTKLGKRIIQILKRVSQLNQEIRCLDIKDDRFYKAMDVSGSFICYPLVSEENTLGALYLYSKEVLKNSNFLNSF